MDRNRVEHHRLALFGRMVTGVAHEIDNHLSVILGFGELIQISGGSEKKTLDSVAKILVAGEKISAIVRQFSQYVRPHPPVREKFSPAEVLQEGLLFSRYDLGRNNVVLALPERYPPVLLAADRRDFVLVLLALLFNGAEAMAGNGGTLRLDVSLQDGACEFVVTDEGPGISPDIAPRIFEEGFTTKEGSFHTGMGLPVARHLADEMGGTISVHDAPSGGCRAILAIPAG